MTTVKIERKKKKKKRKGQKRTAYGIKVSVELLTKAEFEKGD